MFKTHINEIKMLLEGHIKISVTSRRKEHVFLLVLIYINLNALLVKGRSYLKDDLNTV